MTGPANSTTTQGGARTYTWDGESFPSVTTLLGDGVPKKALTYWAANQTAQYVVDNYDFVGEMLRQPNGSRLAYDTLKGAPWRNRDNAAARGTNLHDYADAWAQGLPLPKVPPENEGLVRSLMLFLEEWQPEFVRSEFTIYNKQYGYAGTGDFLANIAGHGLVLADYKTAKKGRQGHGIYPETALQLNAYAKGEFIGMPNGTEAPMPEVDALLAINIRSDGYTVVPCELSDRVHRAFLYAMQVARFVKEGGQFVGDPLAPPIRETA